MVRRIINSSYAFDTNIFLKLQYQTSDQIEGHLEQDFMSCNQDPYWHSATQYAPVLTHGKGAKLE